MSTTPQQERRKPTLYDGLCKAIIARIFEADVKCEPESDVMLRLETIIRQRDIAQEQIEVMRAAIHQAIKVTMRTSGGAFAERLDETYTILRDALTPSTHGKEEA